VKENELTVDPFAEFSETETVKKAAPKKAPVKVEPGEDGGTRVGGTVKGGSGFDVPWLTPSWPTWKAAAEDLADPETQEHMRFVADQLARFSAYFQKKVTEYAPEKAAGTPARSAPAQATEAPAGTPPAPGPDWTYKTGVNSKTGKTWKAWMPPRGSDAQPVWL
jgi:hypothetical protein